MKEVLLRVLANDIATVCDNTQKSLKQLLQTCEGNTIMTEMDGDCLMTSYCGCVYGVCGLRYHEGNANGLENGIAVLGRRAVLDEEGDVLSFSDEVTDLMVGPSISKYQLLEAVQCLL